MPFSSGCSVESNLTATRFALNHVGLKAFTIGYISDLDFLVRNKIGHAHQVSVNTERADIIQTSIGDGSPVNFRFAECDQHMVRLSKFGNVRVRIYPKTPNWQAL